MRATQFKDWMNEHGAEQDCERGSRRTDNTLVVLDYDRFGNASNRLTPVARQ